MEIIKNYSEIEYENAKKTVKEKIGFYWHLTSYIIVNSYLIFLYFQGKGDGQVYYFWPFWPIAGWGIGICFHAIKIFGFFNTKAWEEKEIQKEIEKRRKEREKFGI